MPQASAFMDLEPQASWTDDPASTPARAKKKSRRKTAMAAVQREPKIMDPLMLTKKDSIIIYSS